MYVYNSFLPKFSNKQQKRIFSPHDEYMLNIQQKNSKPFMTSILDNKRSRYRSIERSSSVATRKKERKNKKKKEEKFRKN